MSTVRNSLDEALAVIGRLALFVGVAALVLFLEGVALKSVLPLGLPPGRDGRLLFILLLSFGLVVAHVVVVAMLERTRWEVAGIGARHWRPLALVGAAALGFFAPLVPAAALLAFDAVAIVPEIGTPSAAYVADALVVVGILTAFEELAFRGYVYGLLSDRWGVIVASALTSATYALYIGSAPGALGTQIAAAFAIGCFLAAIRSRSGLAAAWLAHAGLGWSQALVLHLPTHGTQLLAPPGWVIRLRGPAWLTGGEGGLEAGLAVAATVAVVTFLLLRSRRPTIGGARQR